MIGAPQTAAGFVPPPSPSRPAVEAGASDARLARLGILLGLGLLAFHVIVRFDLATLRGDWNWWAIILFRTHTTALAIVAGVAWVERRGRHGTRAGLRYVAAIVAANAVAALAALALLHWTDLPWGGPSRLRWVMFIQLEYMLLAGGAVFAWQDGRRARAAQARLHAAQRRRLDAARAALEVRLQAMQARVEPQLLFDTLARVHRLHPQDGRRAERLLDALVAYLRAAMPRSADGGTTVRREVELVRAWLRIDGGAAGDDEHGIEVAAEALEARIPSMLLLPLVRSALEGGARPTGARPRLRLAVALAGARLELRLACDAARGRAAVEHALGGLRERLDALYGETASLAVRDGPDGTLEAVLAVPFVRARPDAAMVATGRSAS